jgi:hypothetical protein
MAMYGRRRTNRFFICFSVDQNLLLFQGTRSSDFTWLVTIALFLFCRFSFFLFNSICLSVSSSSSLPRLSFSPFLFSSFPFIFFFLFFVLRFCFTFIPYLFFSVSVFSCTIFLSFLSFSLLVFLNSSFSVSVTINFYNPFFLLWIIVLIFVARVQYKICKTKKENK